MCHSRVPRRGLEGSKRTPSHLWSRRSAKANPPRKIIKHWVKDIKITSALMSIPLSSSPKWSNLSEIILCIQKMTWSWFYLSRPLTLQLETSHLSTKTSSALLTPSDEAITNLSPLFQLETSPSTWILRGPLPCLTVAASWVQDLWFENYIFIDKFVYRV